MSRGQNGKFHLKYRVRLDNYHTPVTDMALLEEMKFRVSVIVRGTLSKETGQDKKFEVSCLPPSQFLQCKR